MYYTKSVLKSRESSKIEDMVNKYIESQEKLKEMRKTKLKIVNPSQASPPVTRSSSRRKSVSNIKTPSHSVTSHSGKISQWLSKKTLRDTKALPIIKTKKAKETDHESTSKSDKKEFKSGSTSKKLPRSKSFEKYGIILPSAEEILEQHKKYDEHKMQVEKLEEIEKNDLEFPDFLKENSHQNQKRKYSSSKVLDCKHLTLYEIEKAFYENMAFLKDIFSGEKYSERHERFHNYKMEYSNTVKDLTYSTSLVVFNDEQKLKIVSLLEKELDPNDKNTKYFFQVLLPELCLKIFMNTHNMTRENALEYLDQRPIE